MGEEVVFQNWEIRHGSIDHRNERIIITVFRHDDVAAPCIFFLERTALDILDGFVDWKRHPVTRYSWVKDDIRVGELSVHPVERFYKLFKYGLSEYRTVGRIPKMLT